MPDARALLTVEEVAELLHVPLSWVYERTRKRGVDRIPGFRLGKVLAIPRGRRARVAGPAAERRAHECLT